MRWVDQQASARVMGAKDVREAKRVRLGMPARYESIAVGLDKVRDMRAGSVTLVALAEPPSPRPPNAMERSCERRKSYRLYDGQRDMVCDSYNCYTCTKQGSGALCSRARAGLGLGMSSSASRPS